jgi:hypothetical protein
MKKIITFFIALPFYLCSFSYTAEDLQTAIDNLCKEVMFSQPQNYSQEGYTELAYLKRNFNLNKITISDSAYKSKIFNNYYYDQYYLYSKFLNENAIVTEDCLHIPESTEDMYKGVKILFYVLYPNSIKLPDNIIDQIEEYSTAAEFYGPYKMLNVIYYLKKYNYQNLSLKQKEKLNILENHLSKILYSNYIENKSWNLFRMLSVKVLKMNKNELVKNIDLSILVDYLKNNKPLHVIDEDIKNPAFAKTGFNDYIQQQATSILWIFLLEIK